MVDGPQIVIDRSGLLLLLWLVDSKLRVGTIGGLDWTGSTTGLAEIVPKTRSQTKIAIPLVCVN